MSAAIVRIGVKIIFCIVLVWASIARAQATQPEDNVIRRGGSPATGGASSAERPSLVGDAVRVGLSLAGVIGLIVLMYWGARRMLPQSALGRSSGAIHVLAKTHLSPKQRILLIQVGRRVLVVGDGGSGQLNTLCQIDDPDEAAALIGQIHGETLETSGRSFSSMFGAAKERLDAKGTGPAGEDERDEVESARQELDGLMQQVRGITRQMDRS